MAEHRKKRSSGKRKGLSIRRKLWMAIGVAAVLVMIFAAMLRFLRSRDDIAAYVGNEPITASELRLQVNNNKSLVSAYFNAAYGAEYGNGFWTTDFNGEVPAEKLIEDSLNTAIRNKVLQIMAKERDILPNISFHYILNELKQENENRRRALQNNEPVFGPQQYDEKTYYDLIMSNTQSALEQALRDEIVITEDEIKQKYNETKSNIINSEAITIGKISIPYGNESINKEQAEEQIRELKEKLDSRTELGTAIMSDNVVYEELNLGDKEGHNLSFIYPTMLQKALSLQIGAYSDIFIENNEVILIVCIDRVTNVAEDFENRRESIKTGLLQEKIDRMVTERSEKEEIKINNAVIDRMEQELYD